MEEMWAAIHPTKYRWEILSIIRTTRREVIEEYNELWSSKSQWKKDQKAGRIKAVKVSVSIFADAL
jgi:hypothetical protein